MKKDKDYEEVPYGYCHCGCGQKTTIAKYNDDQNGCVKGEPKKFINHHYRKARGRKVIRTGGYVWVYCPSHPRARKDGYFYEHVLVAEKMLGRFLEPGEVVHHKDEDRTNNSPENLEIFKNNGKHTSFHAQNRVSWDNYGHPCKFDHDAAAKVYEEGKLSVAAVARMFGVSRQTMWTALRNRGVAIRKVGWGNSALAPGH